MIPIPNDVLIGGIIGASLLERMNPDSEVSTHIPSISAISIRFDPDITLLKETIQENFFKEPIDILLSYNTDKYEITVSKSPKRRGDDPLLVLHFCKYDEYKNDAFLTVIIRSGGVPNTVSITLLRHFIKKLQEKKVKYEIW